MDSTEKMPVINLHTCIQGEGQSTGQPMILIRLTKCNLNCMFKGSVCDASETSWKHNPITGSKYSLQDIRVMLLKHPHIKKVMITGGNPTYQPSELMQILKLCKGLNRTVEMEDNGTLHLPIYEGYVDLISMSPKLSNSTPVVGYAHEIDHDVTIEDIEKHEKGRKNLKSMKAWIQNFEYQLKFVISGESDIEEALDLVEEMRADISKVYFMPEGATRRQLDSRRKWLYEKCIDLGINYTDRLHILIYNDKKGV